MARYAEWNKFIGNLKTDTWGVTNVNEVGIAFEKATADVVPKSEVEKQKLEIWRLQGQVNRLKKYDEERDIALHARLIAKAKAEVAMEIFADIAKYERKPIPESKPVYVLKQSDFDELEKKYTEYKV